MELTWYGLSCFRITDRGMATIVTDPYDAKLGLPALKVKGDVVTVSHDADGHNYFNGVTGHEHVLTGPGEYEIGGVFINGIASPRKSADDTKNTIFVLEYDGISVAHLGDLDRVLTQNQIDALGQVNVLLIPVGGGNTLSAAQASEMVSMIEPNIVIPMHYAQKGLKLELSDVDRFLKEMGVSEVEAESSLRLTRTSLPEDGTQVAMLQLKS